MTKQMNKCLTKTLPSYQSSSSNDANGVRNRRSRTKETKKKTSHRICKIIGRRRRKHESSGQTCQLEDSHSSRSIPGLSPAVESGVTYNTSASSSSSRGGSSENNGRTTAAKSVLPAVPAGTEGDELVFSFCPHKSKKKRNGKNVKLTGPMKLSRRLS